MKYVNIWDHLGFLTSMVTFKMIKSNGGLNKCGREPITLDFYVSSHQAFLCIGSFFMCVCVCMCLCKQLNSNHETYQQKLKSKRAKK